MGKNFFFTLFFIVPTILLAQQTTRPFPIIEAGIEAGTQSSGLPSAFSNAFIFPDFIDQERKDKSEKRLSSTNRLGGQLVYGLRFYAMDSAKIHDGKWILGGSFHQKQILGINYQYDLFSTIFYGNSRSAGQTMQIAPLSFTSISWMQVGLNLFRRKGKHDLHLGIYVLKGSNLQQYNFNRGNLITDPEGAFIDLTYQGDIMQSPSNGFNSLQSFSPGLSISSKWDFTISDKSKLSLSVEDLGFISWNNQSVLYSIDTTFRFEGIAINDILTINEELNLDGDSLVERLQGLKATGSQLKWMPFHVFAGFHQIHSEQFSSQVSLQYRNIRAYIPLLRYRLDYNIHPSLKLGITLGYGGFGRFNSSVALAYTAFARHKIELSTFANEGMIAPERFSGNGIGLNYAWLF